MTGLKMITGGIWLGLGANIPGRWGSPREAFDRVIEELQREGLSVVAQSSLYSTPPMGSCRQPRYVNAVIEVRGSFAPASLLRFVKRLERRAGRRMTGRWGPRPLDIDILDFGGRRVGHQRDIRVIGSLQLPHQGLSARGFVLVPLAEAAPVWRHPRTGYRARDILRRHPRLKRGIVPVGELRSLG